ncbi:MAG TPA: gliding motility protein GldL, partial [Bacteroidales bacterium]|nr:gliding motility protein GldL [Bacteroidales bacterium]
ALNTVYELQLQSIQRQADASVQIQNTMGNFVSNIEQTTVNMNRYKEEVDMLTKKISALNSVYGNMLAAMNVQPK